MRRTLWLMRSSLMVPFFTASTTASKASMRSRGLVLLDIEVRIFGYACHESSFLIDAEQRASVQGSYLRNEARQLRFVINIPCIQDDAADGVPLIDAFHLLCHFLQLIRPTKVRKVYYESCKPIVTIVTVET